MQLRAHHGICIHFYKGKGYSETFIRHMTETVETLLQDPTQSVTLVTGGDSLCLHCPNYQEEHCTSQEKVKALDANCLAACGCQEGEQLSWDLYAGLIQTRILQTDLFQKICGSCQWFSLCSEIAGKEKNIL